MSSLKQRTELHVQVSTSKDWKKIFECTEYIKLHCVKYVFEVFTSPSFFSTYKYFMHGTLNVNPEFPLESKICEACKETC